MKKVLKLVLVLAVVSALSLSVFAAVSPTNNTVSPTNNTVSPTNNPVYPYEPVPVPGGASDPTHPVPVPGGIVISATTDAAGDIEVSIVVPGDPDKNLANETAAAKAAKAAGVKVTGTLGSFDVIVKKDGQIINSGVTVNVLLGGFGPYIGKFANIWQTDANGVTRLYASCRITSETIPVSLTEYGTFTVVITDGPMQGATSPRTSQNAVSYVLIAVAVLAFVGVLYANKERKAA